jgi:cytochrome P450
MLQPDLADGTTAVPFPFPFPVVSSLEPSPEYARLREEQPVARVKLPSGDLAWIVTRYEDVRLVFSDPRFSRAAATHPGAPRLMPGIEGDPESIVSKDPPEHTRLRKLVAPAFTSRRLEEMRPRVQGIVAGLLDAMADGGQPADLISSLTSPLPIMVICELLGVPQSDRDRFRVWSDTMFGTSPEAIDAALAAREALIAYLAETIQARREAPASDLLGTLITFRDRDDKLSERELISFAGGLIVAGYETTANRLANAVLILLRHPSQVEALRADTGMLPQAVEELLRYIPGGAAGGLMRVATEDVELGGAKIRAGEGVIAITNSANRDPSICPDPNRFDIARPPTPHVSFGHGVHHCVGAQLARLEIQLALGELFRRFPRLRLAVPENDLEWRKNVVIHSLVTLPVAW